VTFIRKNINQITIPIGIVICGALLRLVKLGVPSAWYDEIYTIRVSTAPLSSVIPEALASRHPPLYYLALHFWSRLGLGDGWMRLLSASAGIATIYLVYAIGRNLFSRRVGLWSAALAAFSPFLIWYSRDATDYSWAIATTSASFYFLIKAAKKGGWSYWSLYIAASVAALFTHYYNILFLLAEVPMFFLIQKPAKRWRPWLISEAALGIVLLPWLIMLNEAKAYAQGNLPHLVVPQLRTLLNGIGTAPITFIRGYAGLMGRGESALFLSGTQKIILTLGVLAAMIIFIFTRRFATGEVQRNLLALAAFTFFAISLPVFLQMAQGELVAGRYYAIASPAFLILLAALINLLPVRVSWAISGLVVLLLLLFLNIQRQGASQEDWRGIMATITSTAKTDDEILCFPLHNCIAAQNHYYNPEDAPYLPVKGGVVSGDKPQDVYLVPPDYVWIGYRGKWPDVSRIDDMEELESQLTLMINNSKRLWLVSGTGNLGNYPKATIIEQTLLGDWILEQEWNFTPLNLKLYERK
jgi:hypothetical protein